MTPRHVARRPDAIRRGFTLLELMLVLVITGILIAAIAAAINIQLRVSEVGRSEVEQAQLARVLLRRIGDDLRGAMPHVEAVAAEAGATADEIAAAAATGSGEAGGSSGGSGSAASGSSPSTGSAGGQTSSGSSGNSGTQTLQPLKALSTLKPQSARSASGSTGGSSSSSSGGSSGSGSSGSGSSGSGSSASNGSATNSTTDSESTEESTSTLKPPGINGDQFTLQVDVGRLPRSSLAFTNGPGDLKTVGYYLAPITSATAVDPAAATSPTMGLFRQSVDRSVANFDASAAAAVGAEPQLLAEEVAALEFRYFDGTAWQTSWDSAGGTLPTAVEILLTFLVTTRDVVEPKQYRLTVAIPAAQAGSSTTATDESAESSAPSSSPGTTP